MDPSEKVSHGNQHPVQTWKLEHGPLDDECADEICTEPVPNFLQITARHCGCLFCKKYSFLSLTTTKGLRYHFQLTAQDFPSFVGVGGGMASVCRRVLHLDPVR
jgi:hypothetical protein